MATTATAPQSTCHTSNLGRAWLALCFALALHVTDEALTGFLGVWNPTVAAVHARWPWFPMPTFTFGPWLGGLIVLVIVLALVTPGIRASTDDVQDQRRTMTAAEAIRAGADYIVVGRPIIKAADPSAAAQRFVSEIQTAQARASQA